MANKADINVILGADFEKSVEQLNKDIAKIEKKINKLNLQVKVQSGNLLAETNKKIAELQKRKTLKQIAINMKLDEGKYIKQVAEVEKQLKKLSEQGNINLNVNSNNASANVSNLNTQLKQTTATANTLGSSIKNALSNVGIYINNQTAWLALRQMIDDINETIQEYDKYVTELSLITNKSRDEVTGMLEGISETALNLKVDVSDVEKAETTILRAGKSIADTQILIEDAVKLSKTGFIGTDEAAEHLITIANAYHLEADEMERIADKFVKLDSSANVTAGKLASAIATTASSAQLAGINIDTLAGYIAALKDTTGKTEQSISTSINTILARMNNIKLNKFEDEIDADEIAVNLNNVERMLNNVNIQLRDSKDEFKDADEVIKEVAEHWKDFTSVEQSSIANVFAGVHNRNVFVSLMENFERAEELANIAAESTGTLSDKYNSYLESIEAKTAELSTATKELWSNILPADFFGNMTDATTATVKFLDQYKILQTLMKSALFYGAAKGIVFLGDSAITAWNSVKQLSTAMTALDTAEKSRNTTNYANNLVSLGNACKGLNDKQLQLVLSTKNLTTAEKQQVLQLSGLTTEEAAAKIQTLGLATAETTATTATFSLSGALKGLWAVISANPLGAITLALTLVVTAVNAVQQAEEEARQATKDLAEQTKEEINELYDLYDAYIDAKEAIDDGTGSKDSLTTATENLIKKIGVEREELQKLIQEYGNLDNAIKKAVADDIIEVKLPNLKEAVKVTGQEVADSAKVIGGYGFSASGDIEKWIEEWNEKAGNILSSSTGYGAKKFSVTLDPEVEVNIRKGVFNDETIQGIKQEIDTLTDLRSDMLKAGLDDSDAYKSINDRINKLSPLYDEYTKALASNNEQAAKALKYQQDISGVLPQTYEEYKKYREELLKSASSDEYKNLFNGNADEIESAIKDTILSDSTLKVFEDRFEALASLTKQYVGDVINSGYQAERKTFLDSLSDEDLQIAAQISNLFENGLDGARAKIAAFKADKETTVTGNDIADKEEIVGTVSDIAKETSAKVKLITTAMTEMKEQGSLTSSTYADISEQGGHFAECLETVDGKLTLNVDKLKDLESQGLENLMIANSYKMATLNEAKAHSGNADAIDEEIEALKRQNALYKTMQDEIKGASPSDKKTTTGTTADEYKTNVEAKIKDIDHLHNMEQLSDEEYYNRLEAINNEYYAGRLEYETEYNKNLETIYKGRQAIIKTNESEAKTLRENSYKERKEALEQANNGTIESEMDFISKWQTLNDELFKTADPTKWAEINREIAKNAKTFFKNLLDNGTYTVEEYKAIINKYFNDMNNIGIDLGANWLADALEIDDIEYDKLKESLSADGDRTLDDVLTDAEKLSEKNIKLFSDDPETLRKNAEDIFKSVSESAKDALDKMLITPDEYLQIIDKWGNNLNISKGLLEEAKELSEDDYLDRWDLDNGYDENKSKDDYELRAKRIEYIYELAEQLYGKNGQKNLKAYNALVNQGLEDVESLVEDYYDEEIKKLEEINDEEEKRQKALELQLNLIKARQKLEEAKNNRNQLVFHNGTFEYMADQDAVMSAGEDLAEAQKAILDQEREDQKEALENQKEETLKFFDSVGGKLDDFIDRVKRLLSGDKDAFKVDENKTEMSPDTKADSKSDANSVITTTDSKDKIITSATDKTEINADNVEVKADTNTNPVVDTTTVTDVTDAVTTEEPDATIESIVTNIDTNVVTISETAKGIFDTAKAFADGFNFENLVRALGGNPTAEAVKNFQDSYNATLVGKQITPSTLPSNVTNNSSTTNNSAKTVNIGDINLHFDLTLNSLDEFVDGKIDDALLEVGRYVRQKLPAILAKA